MKVPELIVTFIFVICIIYTAIPFAFSTYCFIILPHMHNEDAFAATETETETETAAEEEKVADIYIPPYVNHQLKSMDQLQTMLQACNRNRPPSRENHDCSNFAAYTEYYLENRGFNTTISASFSAKHAWVTVHNIIGHSEVNVECIPPAHISQLLGPSEVTYDNIYDALAGEVPSQWLWWDIPEGGRK